MIGRVAETGKTRLSEAQLDGRKSLASKSEIALTPAIFLFPFSFVLLHSFRRLFPCTPVSLIKNWIEVPVVCTESEEEIAQGLV